MYFKHGFYQLKRNMGMNLFVMVQMVIVLFAVVCMGSVADSQYQYYRNFEDYFSKEGWLYYACYAVSGDSRLCTDSGELEESMHKADVAACYEVNGLDCRLESGTKAVNYRIYDHELVTAYTPGLEEGQWLTQAEAEDGMIPVVVSHNDFGIRTGDIIEFSERGTGQDIFIWKAKVAGVLEDGASVVGWPDRNINTDGDYKSLYTSYTLGEQGKPIFLMDMDTVKQAEAYNGGREIPKQLGNVVMVGYDEDITGKEAAENDEILLGSVDYFMRYNMQEIRDNSRKHLKNSLAAYVPVFAGAFILMFISTISISTIVIRQQMRSYAVFHVCGMDWKGCVWINQVNTVLTACMALCLFTVLAVLLRAAGLLEETVVSFGRLQAAGCIVVLAVYILLAGWIPWILTRGRQAGDVLVENIK